MPRTSRQVKSAAKHTKSKKPKTNALKSRQARLGGTRSQRLQTARTSQLPQLQHACPCPCGTTVGPQVTVAQMVAASGTVSGQANATAIATGAVAFIR